MLAVKQGCDFAQRQAGCSEVFRLPLQKMWVMTSCVTANRCPFSPLAGAFANRYNNIQTIRRQDDSRPTNEFLLGKLPMSEQTWKIEAGDGPLVATAIHAGGDMREETLAQVALDQLQRLREEDPFTDLWTAVAPTRVVGTRSRFEVDLNRPRDKAVYRVPEDAWGLHVWKDTISDEVADRSLAQYDAFYQALEALYGQLAQQHGTFVVYDIHTYNHRRDGPDGPEADPAGNPQVNIGTGTLSDRTKFAGIIDRFIHDLSAFDFPGGKLDVRENVKFFGGQHPRWAHQRFPDNACVLAVEFKKFFMDEWSGEPDMSQVDAIGEALAATVPGVLEELAKVAK